MGIMTYVASPIWMLFLLISSIHAFRQVLAGGSLRPHAEAYTSVFGFTVEVPEAFALFLFTLLLLFLPKLISVLLALGQQRARAYGGPLRLGLSALIEVLVSTLLAPVNMMFNTKFVLYILLGQGVPWVTQQRAARA